MSLAVKRTGKRADICSVKGNIGSQIIAPRLIHGSKRCPIGYRKRLCFIILGKHSYRNRSEDAEDHQNRQNK